MKNNSSSFHKQEKITLDDLNPSSLVNNIGSLKQNDELKQYDTKESELSPRAEYLRQRNRKLELFNRKTYEQNLKNMKISTKNKSSFVKPRNTYSKPEKIVRNPPVPRFAKPQKKSEKQEKITTLRYHEKMKPSIPTFKLKSRKNLVQEEKKVSKRKSEEEKKISEELRKFTKKKDKEREQRIKLKKIESLKEEKKKQENLRKLNEHAKRALKHSKPAPKYRKRQNKKPKAPSSSSSSDLPQSLVNLFNSKSSELPKPNSPFLENKLKNSLSFERALLLLKNKNKTEKRIPLRNKKNLADPDKNLAKGSMSSQSETAKEQIRGLVSYLDLSMQILNKKNPTREEVDLTLNNSTYVWKRLKEFSEDKKLGQRTKKRIIGLAYLTQEFLDKLVDKKEELFDSRNEVEEKNFEDIKLESVHLLKPKSEEKSEEEILYSGKEKVQGLNESDQRYLKELCETDLEEIEDDSLKPIEFKDLHIAKLYKAEDFQKELEEIHKEENSKDLPIVDNSKAKEEFNAIEKIASLESSASMFEKQLATNIEIRKNINKLVDEMHSVENKLPDKKKEKKTQNKEKLTQVSIEPRRSPNKSSEANSTYSEFSSESSPAQHAENARSKNESLVVSDMPSIKSTKSSAIESIASSRTPKKISQSIKKTPEMEITEQENIFIIKQTQEKFSTPKFSDFSFNLHIPTETSEKRDVFKTPKSKSSFMERLSQSVGSVGSMASNDPSQSLTQYTDFPSFVSTLSGKFLESIKEEASVNSDVESTHLDSVDDAGFNNGPGLTTVEEDNDDGLSNDYNESFTLVDSKLESVHVANKSLTREEREKEVNRIVEERNKTILNRQMELERKFKELGEKIEEFDRSHQKKKAVDLSQDSKSEALGIYKAIEESLKKEHHGVIEPALINNVLMDSFASSLIEDKVKKIEGEAEALNEKKKKLLEDFDAELGTFDSFLSHTSENNGFAPEEEKSVSPKPMEKQNVAQAIETQDNNQDLCSSSSSMESSKIPKLPTSRIYKVHKEKSLEDEESQRSSNSEEEFTPEIKKEAVESNDANEFITAVEPQHSTVAQVSVAHEDIGGKHGETEGAIDVLGQQSSFVHEQGMIEAPSFIQENEEADSSIILGGTNSPTVQMEKQIDSVISEVIDIELRKVIDACSREELTQCEPKLPNLSVEALSEQEFSAPDVIQKKTTFQVEDGDEENEVLEDSLDEPSITKEKQSEEVLIGPEKFINSPEPEALAFQEPVVSDQTVALESQEEKEHSPFEPRKTDVIKEYRYNLVLEYLTDFFDYMLEEKYSASIANSLTSGDDIQFVFPEVFFLEVENKRVELGLAVAEEDQIFCKCIFDFVQVVVKEKVADNGLIRDYLVEKTEVDGQNLVKLLKDVCLREVEKIFQSTELLEKRELNQPWTYYEGNCEVDDEFAQNQNPVDDFVNEIVGQCLSKSLDQQNLEELVANVTAEDILEELVDESIRDIHNKTF
eukprot:snap_masked-scaffold_8-processed-gene-6.24-mRNA-1 protein AED:1.00 eAED:1.00 QI:0/-1/0/0/-1/1/1/0/1471